MLWPSVGLGPGLMVSKQIFYKMFRYEITLRRKDELFYLFLLLLPRVESKTGNRPVCVCDGLKCCAYSRPSRTFRTVSSAAACERRLGVTGLELAGNGRAGAEQRSGRARLQGKPYSALERGGRATREGGRGRGELLCLYKSRLRAGLVWCVINSRCRFAPMEDTKWTSAVLTWRRWVHLGRSSLHQRTSNNNKNRKMAQTTPQQRLNKQTSTTWKYSYRGHERRYHSGFVFQFLTGRTLADGQKKRSSSSSRKIS